MTQLTLDNRNGRSFDHEIMGHAVSKAVGMNALLDTCLGGESL
jgi:hypothetical protein